MIDRESVNDRPYEPNSPEDEGWQSLNDGNYDALTAEGAAPDQDIPDDVPTADSWHLEPPLAARIVIPEDNPRQTHVYSLSGREVAGASVGLSPLSSLADQGYNFAANGSNTPDTTMAYPEKMHIGSRTGELLIHAKAVRSDSRRLHFSGVLTETGEMTVEEPPLKRGLGERSVSAPPDEIRLEVVPNDPRQATDAFEALLRGYAVDVEDRLTVPDDNTPGVSWFKAEAVANGWTPHPVSSLNFRDNLIGGSHVGIVRLTLNDGNSAINAVRRNTETVEVKAARDALSRLGCEVTGVKVVEAESLGLYSGIEINFRRRPDNTIDGDTAP